MEDFHSNEKSIKTALQTHLQNIFYSGTLDLLQILISL